MPSGNPTAAFPCPYCTLIVQKGDTHAHSIIRKNLKDTPTITVTCMVVRTFGVTLAPVTESNE